MKKITFLMLISFVFFSCKKSDSFVANNPKKNSIDSTQLKIKKVRLNFARINSIKNWTKIIKKIFMKVQKVAKLDFIIIKLSWKNVLLLILAK